MRNGPGDAVPERSESGRRDAAPAGAAADRWGHQLPGAVRHHGREPDADPRRAPARGRDHAGGSEGQGPGARGRRRLQHRRGCRTREGSRSAGRRRPPLGDAVLQQAHPGRPVPALQGDRLGRAAAHRRLQRAGPHRRQRRARDAEAARRHREHRRSQGSFGQHQPDRRRSSRRCPSASTCSRATMRSRCR